MNNFFNTFRNFFAPPVFAGDEEKTRTAELVNTILVTLTGVLVLALVGIIAGSRLIGIIVALIVILVLLLSLQIPLRRGYVKPVALSTVILLTTLLAFSLGFGGTIRAPAVVGFTLASVIAGLTIGRRAALWSTIVNILLFSGLAYGEISHLLPTSEQVTTLQQPIIFAALSILTVVLVNQALSRIQTAVDKLTELNVGLEQRVAERTKALEVLAEISHRLASILDPRQLASAVVNEVQTAYNYYYAQIYLFDETGENLVLTAGTGEPGAAMMKRGHSLPKGRGLVGRAAVNRESILVSDTSQDPNWLPNELLPDTKSEAVVPIIIGDKVLGVLDVQDDVTNDIFPEDITLLESLAGQVAISLQNAESYAIAATALQEARSLVENAAEGIAVLDLTNGLFTEPNENIAKVYGLSRDELVKVGPAQMSPPTQPDGRDSTEKAMEQIGIAMQKGTHVFEWVHINGQGKEFPAEIRLVRMPGDHPRVRVTVIDITERQALQKLTAQRARQQEAINTITQKIQAATTIEEAMQVAARELGHALGNRQTLVALDASALTNEREAAAS